MESVTIGLGQQEEEVLGEEGAMLWSSQEAFEKQTLQIGASACGATAVVDVLKALDVDVAPEEVDRCVETLLRRNKSPLPDYLLSRSEAGECLQNVRNHLTVIIIIQKKKKIKSCIWTWILLCPGATHAQLIQGAEEASQGKVSGRFFHLYPRRRVRLVTWLAHWIRKGAVPVATMNMQLAVPDGEEVPDAWHHQLIFGVVPNAVFMTNPLDVGELR